MAEWLRVHPGSKGIAVEAGIGIEINQIYNAKSFITKFLPTIKATTDGQKAGMTCIIR